MMSQDKSLLLKFILLTIFNAILAVFINGLEFYSINKPLSIDALLLYTALSSTSILISITPGSIGIREAVLAIFSETLNISTQEILEIAIIDRGVLFFTLIILFTVTKFIPNAKIKEPDQISED